MGDTSFSAGKTFRSAVGPTVCGMTQTQYLYVKKKKKTINKAHAETENRTQSGSIKWKCNGKIGSKTNKITLSFVIGQKNKLYKLMAIKCIPICLSKWLFPEIASVCSTLQQASENMQWILLRSLTFSIALAKCVNFFISRGGGRNKQSIIYVCTISDTPRN